MDFASSVEASSKYHSRAHSLPRAQDASNRTTRPRGVSRTHPPPASPEVISSLITSLSVISTPFNDHFENPNGNLSSPASPSHAYSRHSYADRHTYDRGPPSGGSFGIDYGAFAQPSLRDLQEEVSLDDLPASPPVIRTSKPPSGLSTLTAPRTTSREASPFKVFMRGSSRPGSEGSRGSKDRDDASSIGSVSIEPGLATPAHELRRRRSTDSWGKKQKSQKALLYMSSKERLRGQSQERKRTSFGAVGATRPTVLGIERLGLPVFDDEHFMAETALSEEPPSDFESKYVQAASYTSVTSPTRTCLSPNVESNPGGIGSGRYIPVRESSLRHRRSSSESRSVRATRHSGRHRDGEGSDIDQTILEEDERQDRRRERINAKDSGHAANTPDIEDRARSRQYPQRTSSMSASAMVGTDENGQPVEDDLNGAPFPAIAQRKARDSAGRLGDALNTNKKPAKKIPEPLDVTLPKRNSSRLKRLSVPMSPTSRDKEAHQRSSSTPMQQGQGQPGKSLRPTADDRPSSADSVDDAVESYLKSPRLSQKIKHPQTGRTISFSEVGDAEGFAVFCCVGMGLTRYITAFYDELALTLKLRLITPDRPGVGDSEPYTDGTSTPLSWPGKILVRMQLSITLRILQTTSTQSVRRSKSPNSPSSPTRPAPSTPWPPHSVCPNISVAASTSSPPGSHHPNCP